MKKLLILLFLVNTIITNAQTTLIDSLTTELKKASTLDKKFVIHIKLAEVYSRKKPDSSRYFSDIAEDIARELKSDSLLAIAYFKQAYTEYYQSNDVFALNRFSKIDSLADLNNNLLHLVVQTKIYRSEISKFTFTMEGVLKAREYLKEGIDIAKRIDDTYLEHKLLQRLASWHGFISQEVEPKKHLDSAKALSEKILPYFLDIKDLNMAAEIYEDLARINESLGRQKESDINRLKNLNTLKEIGDSLKIAEAYYYWGASYKKKSPASLGIKYLDTAKIIYESVGYPNITEKKDLYRDYAYLYSDIKDYEKAFEHMQKALVFSYDAYKAQNVKSAMEMEAKYETEKKEKEIALLEAQKNAIEAQKANQRNLFIAGLGFFLVIGVFLFLALRNRQRTNKKLKELDSAKSRFFENISHEFRTPLSLIHGPIQDQLNKETLDPQEKRNMTIAKNNASRVLTLVDQILDLSKLEANQYKLRVKNYKLSDFLKATISSFIYQSEVKQQQFISEINVNNRDYWFDRDVLEKVINNLISNAIKYTPEHHKIQVVAEIKESLLQIEITNTGVELSEEELKNIFSRFHRAHENTTGTGIGLALTKELVELHKGNIYAKSYDNWIRFVCNIPIEEKFFSSEEMERNRSIVSESNVSTDRMPDVVVKEKGDNTLLDDSDAPILLIVDDNAELREYLSSLFKNDFIIKTAQNGKEGYEKAKQYVPDVIITDLMMPKEDGLQLTKNSKTHQTTSHIPIMMLTAKAGDESKLEGIEVGADAYVTKPFNTEILKATVNNLLESRKKLQERFSQEVILTPKEISVSSYDEQFLSNLQDVMDANLVESDFNAENFALALGMSRMQLHRKLKALTGLSTTEFIRSQRLKLAAQLLKKSEINVSQVGYTVGFNNHSYFTKCFKEQFGVSPSDYAKS